MPAFLDALIRVEHASSSENFFAIRLFHKCGSHFRVASKHGFDAVESGPRDATLNLDAYCITSEHQIPDAETP